MDLCANIIDVLHVQLQTKASFICWHIFLIQLMHTVDAMQFAESGILILGINTIIMHAPYRKQL